MPLAGCATFVPQQKEMPPRILSAAVEPAGFYPGRIDEIASPLDLSSGLIVTDPNTYATYLNGAEINIKTVQTKIEAIKTEHLKPSCIGADIYICMATMSRLLSVTTDAKAGAIALDVHQDNSDPLLARDRVSVTGKKIQDETLQFYAFIPGSSDGTLTISDAILVKADLNTNYEVRRLTVDLPGDPYEAETEAEYDRTGLYTILSAIGVAGCGGVTKLDIYRTVESRVKPKSHPTHDFQASMADISETNGETGSFSLCGHRLTFYSFAGHSVSAASEYNETGSIGGSMLTVE